MYILLEKILRANERSFSGGRLSDFGFIKPSGKLITDIQSHEKYAREYFKKRRIGVRGIAGAIIAKYLQTTGSIRYDMLEDERDFTIVTSVNPVQMRVIRTLSKGKKVIWDIADNLGDTIEYGEGLPSLVKRLKKMDLLEKMLQIDEDAAGLKSLYKIYKGQEKRLDPDPADLFTALSMMEKYYKDYLKWYAKYAGVERNIEEFPIRQDYQKRLQEIQKVLKSTDTKEQMIALDNAVNQWHMDYPVIAHLGMEADEDTESGEEFVDLVDNIAEILVRMGRLPKESPYAKIRASVKESSIDFPREGLDPAVWNREDDSYVLKDEVKEQIIEFISKYPDKDLNDIAKEIHIVGSIGTNLFQDTADIDVHIIPENIDEWSEETVNEVRKWFNEHRDELDGYINKHPIEVYVQLDVNQDLMSDGCYSLLNDKWLVGPKIAPMDFDPYEDFSHIADDIKSEVEDVDALFGELKRDVIDYDVIHLAMERMSGKDKERLLQKLQDKLNELEDDIETLFAKRKDWVDKRHKAAKPTTPEQALKDIELAKRWKDTNATFKFIDRYKYLKTIKDLQELLSDEEITPDEVDKIKSIMGV